MIRVTFKDSEIRNLKNLLHEQIGSLKEEIKNIEMQRIKNIEKIQPHSDILDELYEKKSNIEDALSCLEDGYHFN